MREQKFFQTLLRGFFDPNQLEVRLVPAGSSLRKDLQSEVWIEGAWQEFIRQGNKPWPGDLKPKRYRLVDLAPGSDSRIILTADPCVSYREFIGTQAPEFAARFGMDFVSRAIATSILIRTNDGKTLITVRDKRTDYKWHGWHASLGGHWEIDKNETPLQAALRELWEEAGIGQSEIEKLELLGVINNPWTAHPDIIYSAETSLASSDILSRNHDDENSIFFIDTTADSYEHLMAKTMHASVIVPLAAMLWVGSQLFGNEWEQNMLNLMAEESKDYGDAGARIMLEKRDIAAFSLIVQESRLPYTAA